MADREQMVGLVSELQHEFARLVRRIDQDELPSAVASAREIAAKINDVLGRVQADFATDFKNHRLRTLSSDMDTIQKFEATPPTRENLAELARVAAHFSRHVRAIDNLVKLSYPRKPFSIRPLIDKYGKVTAISVGSLLLIYIVSATYTSYHSKRVGLVGQYCADSWLKNPERWRNDAEINFRWGRGGPFRNWRYDDFSVRWSGFLYVPFAERYEFTTISDDGCRLFLADKTLISDWKIHPAARDTAEVRLKEGYYPISVEYFESRGEATMRLLWRQVGEAQAHPIESSNLVPSARFLQPGMPVFDTLDADAILSAPNVDRPSPAAQSGSANVGGQPSKDAEKGQAGKSPAKPAKAPAAKPSQKAAVGK